MQYKDKFGELIRQARLHLAKTDKERYSQEAVAKRVKVSQTVYSKYESGGFDRLPDPDILDAIAAELHLTTAQLLEASGYDIGFDSFIERTSLSDFVKLKYGIENPDDFAPGLEKLLRGAANQSRVEGKGEERPVRGKRTGQEGNANEPAVEQGTAVGEGLVG